MDIKMSDFFVGMKKTKKSSQQIQKNEKPSGEKISKSEQKKIERNTLNAIPYDKMYRNGLCEINSDYYSATMGFTDINYQIASDEDRLSIFGKYMEILNSLSSPDGIELTLQNRILDEEEFKHQTLLKGADDDLNKYRDEMNAVMLSNIQSGNNAITSESMITYTTKQENEIDAYKDLKQVCSEYTARFKQLGSNCEMMSGIDRLKIIHRTFDPVNNLVWNYNSCEVKTTKQAIAPASLNFSDKNIIEIGTPSGTRYAKVMHLKNYSTELSDKLISDIAKLEYNLTLSFHMRVMDNAEAIGLIKTQNAKMELQKMKEQKRALKGGWDPEMIPHELRYALEEADTLLKDVQQRNQRLFTCQFVIMPNCESKEKLIEVEKKIKNLAKKHSTEIADLDYLQEAGLGAVLPLGITYLPISRTLTTAVCSTFIPFTSQELLHKNGAFYYGINAISNNLIMCNRRYLLNPSGWILGKPGGGKSFAAKREMVSAMLASEKNDVIVIDPENEYGFIAKLFNGSVINVSNKSGVYLNPLEGDIEAEDDFVKTKSEFLQAMCSAIVGERGITPSICSIIDRCTRQMYARYIEKVNKCGKDSVEMPTFTDFYEILKEQQEKEAETLATSIEFYVIGSNDLFAKKSNVNVNNRFTVYNIKDLGKSLTQLGQMVILESLWERIMLNKKLGKTTYVYVDEIYLLFKSSYGIMFFKELWKRARKYDAIITGITQNVEELLQTTEIRTMLSNSEFILMLNQSTSDRDELTSLLNISDQQATYISNSEEGSGLLFNGQVIVPFKDQFPKDTLLYKAMTTKPEERNKLDKLMD